MKKLLFILTFFVSQQLFAQTFSDDFESYKVGDFVAKTNPKWTTWTNKPGTTEDTKVSDEKAHSGTKSAKFSSTATGGGPSDLLLPLFGDLTQTHTTGIFESTMWIFIPTGKTAYFNYQGLAPAGQSWSLEGNFLVDGTFQCKIGSGAVQGTTTYTQDAWVKYSCKIDLSQNIWIIKLNDVEVANYTSTKNSLYAMNLFPTNANALFYVDDISTKYTAPVATNDLPEHPFFQNIYPNPTTSVTYIDLNINNLSEISIDVTDLMGKVVASRNYGKMAGKNTLTVQCADFPTGIYFARIKIGNDIVTKKIVKE